MHVFFLELDTSDDKVVYFVRKFKTEPILWVQFLWVQWLNYIAYSFNEKPSTVSYLQLLIHMY